ncbi:MAG: hypothetical protein M1835_004386 [Candelina submexicana]|nr:MAG: hypothetical protein M1835_004386 [Candelina submexicana]
MPNPSIASIPLLCNICPKKPKFSDVSHLLTHVSSKAHLSNYYKVRVRGGTEPDAREQVAAYDRWYEEYGVELLMSQRMHCKDKKSARSERKSTRVSSSATTRRRNTNIPVSTIPNEGSDDHLDPRLSYDAGVESALNHPPMATAAQHKAHIPRMHLWPTSRDQMFDSPTPLKSPDPTSDGSTSSGTPTMDPNFDPCITYSPTRFPASDSLNYPAATHEDTARDAHLEEALDDFDLIEESTKLKGVLWPGMALFDSATPEMRRKRNQKKDGSILEQMKLNSVEVEPTELIFTPEGSLKRERRISGLVEEDSPLKPVKPPPKKRAKKGKRPILGEMDPNQRSNQGAAKATLEGPRPAMQDLGAISKEALLGMDGQSHTRPYCERQTFEPTDDEQAEFRLTFGNIAKTKKRGFKIFEDKDTDTQKPEPTQYHQHPHSYGYGSQPFGNSQGLTLLNSECRVASSVEPTASQRPNDADRQGVTSLFKQSAPRPRNGANKENIEPLINCYGRIDAQGGQTQRSTQRYFSVEGAYPPHFFQTLPPSLSYHAFGGPDIRGYSPNPLFSNFQQPPRSFHPHYSQMHRGDAEVSVRPEGSKTEESRSSVTSIGTSRGNSADCKDEDHILPKNNHAQAISDH